MPARGRRFPAQPDRGDARPRLRDRRRAGADPGAATASSTAWSRPASGCCRAGRPFLADPILDPIHFGFTASIVRYHELRRRLPEAEMLMGVGNLTELTDADTTGITMTLMGMVSELAIRNILVVQVSPHCRRAVREAELARRILYRRQGRRQPAAGLRRRACWPCATGAPSPTARPRSRRRRPRSATPTGASRSPRTASTSTTATATTWPATRSTSIPRLGVEQDGAHAFYLGVELARAQVAHQLGKRYVQDNELRWGVAVPPPREDRLHFVQRRQHAGGAAQGPAPAGALMPFIRESIVTTLNADGSAHVAPLGVIVEEPFLVIAPFHPSTTLDNLRRHPLRLRQLHDRRARVRRLRDPAAARLAGGAGRARRRAGGWRRRSPTPRSRWREVVEDEQRPRFRCRTVHEAAHAPFLGFNRAQAAVSGGRDPGLAAAHAAGRRRSRASCATCRSRSTRPRARPSARRGAG